jgi:hypothetical protein
MLLLELNAEWNRCREAEMVILRAAYAERQRRRSLADYYLERRFFPFKEPLLLRVGELARVRQLERRAAAIYGLEEGVKSGEIKPSTLQTPAGLEKAIRRMIRREAGLLSAVKRGQLL